MDKNITFQGNNVELMGKQVNVGDNLPEFKLTAKDMSEITLNNFNNKVLVISVVPSIDTPVCATQTRKFNQQLSNMSSDVEVLTVSMDLPFAMGRFCGAEGIDRVTMASDYKYRSFGENYGVLIKDLYLLTRAVIVADRSGKVSYCEYVSEITNEPNYEKAIEQASKLV